MTGYLCDPEGVPYDAGTFDLLDYVSTINPRLLEISEGRRALTRLDPLTWAVLYFPHLLKNPEGQITFSDVHLQMYRDALELVREVGPKQSRRAYVSPRGSGKPVNVDALVLMGDGSRKRLGDVEVGDWVMTHMGRARRVIEVHRQGKQPSVRITTRRGRVVDAAVDHPFLTEGGWVSAGDLKGAGGVWGNGSRQMRTCDKIATVPAPEVVTGASRSPEEFALAGYFIGDGSATYSSVVSSAAVRKRRNGINSSLTVADPVQLAHIRKVVETLGFTLTGPHGSYGYYVGGGGRRWLWITGIAASSSYTKRVPSWVFAAPPQRIASFLAAYFACDGYVRADGNVAEFYSVSRELLWDVQHLLHRLGVRAVLRAKRGQLNGRLHHSWRLVVENVADFAQAILPYLHSVKSARLSKATARGRFDNFDHVISVETIGPIECRCLTVEDDHTFTANDLVVHNSTTLFLAIPLWAACHGWCRFVAAFSSSATQAQDHLAGLRREMHTNQLLRADYPELCTPARKHNGTPVADSQAMLHTSSGFSFAARGIDTEVLGLVDPQNRRPDMLLLDDIESEEGSYSIHQAKKRLITMLDGVLPMNDRAHVRLVGTVTLPGAIMHQLVKSVTEPGEPEGWIVEENFETTYFPPLVKTADGGERSLWPGKWSTGFLQSIAHTRSFAKNFANKPVRLDGDFWTPQDFVYGELDNISRVLLQIDPAVTDKKTSDYYGIAVVACQSRRNGVLPRCVVRYARQFRMPPARLRSKVLELLAAYPEIGAVRIETNQGGDTWKSILHDLPVRLLVHTESAPKAVRAAGLLNHYQRHRVLHACKLPEAEEQMCSYPDVLNDDLIDAIGAAARFLLDRRGPGKATVKTLEYA